MIETIFVDVDETLIDDNFNIPQENIEAILKVQNEGIDVLLNTGRTIGLLQPIIDTLNIKDLIVMNGAIIYGASGLEVLYQKSMEDDHVQAIFNYAVDHQESMHIFTKDDLYIYNISEVEYVRNQQLGAVYSNLERLDMVKDPIIKVMIEKTDMDYLAKVRENLLDLINAPLELTFSSHRYLEINSPGTSKGDAVMRYLKMKNKSLATTMVIGDSLNDLSMFQIDVAKKVAVANAVEPVKAHAHVITEKDAGNAAVAEALNRFVLEI